MTQIWAHERSLTRGTIQTLTKKDLERLLDSLRIGVQQDTSDMIERQKHTAKVQKEIDNLREVLRDEMDDEQPKTRSDTGDLKRTTLCRYSASLSL